MKKALTLITFIFALTLLQGQDVPVDLSYKLEKKGKYPLKLTTDVKVNQVINNQKVNVQAKTKMFLQLEVKKLERGYFATDATFTDLDIDMKTVIDGKDMNLGKTKSIIESSVKNMRKKSFDLNITEKGKLAKVFSTQDAINQSILQTLKSYKKEPIGHRIIEQVREQLVSSFGEATITSNIDPIIGVLPNKLVKVGDSWDISSFLTNGINEQTKTTYTLVEITKDYILIQGKAIINIENKKIVLNQGQETFITISGENNSEIKLNPKDFWIKSARVTQNIKGEMRVSGDRSHSDGYLIPIDSYSESVVEN